MTDVAGEVRALRARLAVVASPLGVDALPELAGEALQALAAAVASDLSAPRIWLLGAAVAGGYPTPDEVDSTRRLLRLAAPGTEFAAVLEGVAGTAAVRAARTTTIRLVTGVVVDVDFCAKFAHNTGIQRVVRRTLPHWTGGRDAHLVAWTSDTSAYRDLTPGEREMVVEWRSGLPAPQPDPDAESTILVPWGATLVLPEVPMAHHLERLRSLAQSSGNRLCLIGYDAIPIVSADTVVDAESNRFAHYLSVVKHGSLVAAISDTTAEEFRGFASALPAQGLTGPEVVSVPLPVDVPAPVGDPPAPREGLPLVLMVGSIEARKNQYAVLSAAETLWAEGLAFELYIVGSGNSWYLREFDREVRRLAATGRPVRVGRGVSDDELTRAYRDARLVVFPSLQEGYGLPVAEALAMGIPVVTTRYGSTAEIAAPGGCLLVDPRDDEDIARAVRQLLVDDEVHARLVAEAAARVNDTWGDYADRLWRVVTGKAA
jgi:glycosyltransferase involved in cell wall biosynthesis